MFPNGTTAVQSQNANTWRRLQIQTVNDDIAVYKSTDGGQTWPSVKTLITNAQLAFIGGATAIEIGYDSVAHKDYLGFHYDNGNITVISFTEAGINCDAFESGQWRTKWRK